MYDQLYVLLFARQLRCAWHRARLKCINLCSSPYYKTLFGSALLAHPFLMHDIFAYFIKSFAGYPHIFN